MTFTHGAVRKVPVTIRDVARESGVSVSTVSKALNGRGQLRPETRTQVRSIAERLGFRPNDIAQSLLGVCDDRLRILRRRGAAQTRQDNRRRREFS